jgi:hypothetical protein
MTPRPNTSSSQSGSAFEQAKAFFQDCLRDNDSEVTVKVPSRAAAGAQAPIEAKYYQYAFWRPVRCITANATNLALDAVVIFVGASIVGLVNPNPLPSSSPGYARAGNNLTRNTFRPALTVAGSAIDGQLRSAFVAGTDEDPGYTPVYESLRREGAGSAFVQVQMQGGNGMGGTNPNRLPLNVREAMNNWEN